MCKKKIDSEFDEMTKETKISKLETKNKIPMLGTKFVVKSCSYFHESVAAVKADIISN